MEGSPYPASARPASGGLIRLQARLTDLITWLGPAWAASCGVVASGNFGWQAPEWLQLALVILLVDGGWGTLWAAVGGTNWAKPLRRWRNWRFGEPLATPPYTLPESPGDRASRWLGQLRAWWRNVLWPSCGPAISATIVSLPIMALLGVMLGTESVLLSIAAVAMMQLGMAWEGGRGSVAPGWDAIITVTLPWLAGHAAFGPLTPRSVGLALVFGLAWGAAWRANLALARIVGIGAQLLTALLLIGLHHPLAASTIVIMMAPQLAMLPWLQRGQSISNYVRYTRPWLMAAMLVAAWAL